MSQKTQRAKARKNKEKKRKALSRRPRVQRVAQQDVAYLLSSCEISFDAIPDPDIAAIPQPEQGRIHELIRCTVEGEGADKIEMWESLCRRFPHIPMFRNMLQAAYQAAGRTDDVDRQIETTYRDFPEYVFGIVTYCSSLIGTGQIEEAKRIIGDCYLIERRYAPGRVFHVTEVNAWNSLMAHYFFAIDKPEVARTYVAMIRKLDAGHPMLETLRWVERSCDARSLLRRIKGAFSRYSAD